MHTYFDHPTRSFPVVQRIFLSTPSKHLHQTAHVRHTTASKPSEPSHALTHLRHHTYLITRCRLVLYFGPSLRNRETQADVDAR